METRAPGDTIPEPGALAEKQPEPAEAPPAPAETPPAAAPASPPAEAVPAATAAPAVITPVAPPAAAAPVPAPVAGNAPSDLTRLKGLGPKVAARLGELDITRIDQLAALSPGEAEALDAQLGTFRGRMARDRWIEQAKLLAAGDRAGFEAAFGKL